MALQIFKTTRTHFENTTKILNFSLQFKSNMRTVLFFLLLITMHSKSYGSIHDLSRLLPNKSGQWLAKDSDHYYDNETLYNYIDGGAELYISYNFDKVVSRRFVREGHPDLVIELFDMQQPRNALGVFTNMREMNQNEFGQGSQYIEGSMIFWKDRYFVVISCITIDSEIKEAIYDLARKTDNAITSKGEVPSVLKLLPQNGLATEGYTVFHHYIWTNSFYFISNDNILNINDSTNAVLAKYGDRKHRTYLMIVEYPETETAKKAHENFIKIYSKGTGPQKVEDKTWHIANLKDRYVIAVFNGDDKKQTVQLALEAEQNISKR